MIGLTHQFEEENGPDCWGWLGLAFALPAPSLDRRNDRERQVFVRFSQAAGAWNVCIIFIRSFFFTELPVPSHTSLLLT